MKDILERISQFIAIIDRMSIRSEKVLQGLFSGIHKSPYLGYSANFEDHRQYEIGDNIKLIDWPLWARTEKLFIKRFKEDTNSYIYILLDNSLSMIYPEDEITKLDRAKELAILLFLLFRKQNDRVSFGYFDDNFKFLFPPQERMVNQKDFIESLAKIMPEGRSDFYKNIVEFSNNVHKRGIVIILSDLIFQSDDLKKGLELLNFHKHEILTIQILSKNEFNPKSLDDGFYLDPENKDKKIFSSNINTEKYKSSLDEWLINMDMIFNDLELKRIIHLTESDLLKFIMELSEAGNNGIS
jgi:hypothetical protein